MYKPSKAVRKILGLRSKIRIIEGGQGAGKTIGILMILIDMVIKYGCEMTIFQYERTKMERTVLRDFIKIMRSYNYYSDQFFNKSKLIYRFPRGFIEFVGLDNSDIGKGFRRDVIYFNEINRGRITLDAFTQINSRAKITFMDYNPDAEFWVHSELKGSDNVDFLRLTYLDNEYLGEDEKQSILNYKNKGYNNDGTIKNSYWANKWRVYGLGLPGVIEGQILTDWDVIGGLPEEARYIGSGLDFGYSQDPTAVVSVFKYNNELILREELFRIGMTNRDIADSIKDKVKIVYCDSAEPKSIKELQLHGIRAFPAPKGKDSVMYGIDLMKQYRFRPLSNSKNLIEAMRLYSFDTDRSGNLINKPNHLYSDIIDALRYFMVSHFGKGIGNYSRPQSYKKAKSIWD